MKRTILVFFQIVLLIMLCVPAAWADSSISISLNKTSASVGEIVSVTGTTSPDSWVPIKVLDEAKNIVLFDTGKADGEGRFGIDFKVPDNAPGILTVIVGEGNNVKTAILNGPPDEKPNSSGGGGGGGGVAAQPVYSTTGSATVTPRAGGTISLGDDAAIEIPANALTGTGAQEIKITRVSDPSQALAGFRLLGNVFEFRIGGMSSYNFDKKITITLIFNPDALKSGETPAIYYYDENKQEWVCLGGIVSGNTISVQVDHFTKFAVFVKEKAPEKVPEKALTDISGHWAEKNINKLAALEAVSGYPDGTFKPDNKITRSEFTAILVKAFNLEPKSGKVFADTVGHWAKDSIAVAASYGIVNGYDENTFGPDDTITREQMAVMIVQAAKLTPVPVELPFADSNDISGWARESVAAAVHHGIINGYPDNTVRPQGSATRSEAVTVIVNAL
ncbi:MAG: S-layer homology domain-containing protein [Syntrophomonadaceae bacterium]|jgi:hypothetical protein|nr:S-layer homology domain-containing protein [Syntrophomonadaceae bacterium]